MNKIFYTLFLVLICYNVNGQAEPGIPHLKQQGDSKQLIVNGKPTILLSSELTNSAGSSMSYMEPVWPKLKRLNLNSVIAPVSWELTEPEEGKFDFTVMDELIAKARENNMKLVLLWFGSWKNAGSSYPPAWVRQNTKRFPRRQTPEGENSNSLSCFFAETWSADARAFGATMRHLKEIDGKINTVVAVQVQNEAGARKFPRDYSPAANKIYNSEVPGELISFLQKNQKILVPEFDAIWKNSNYRTTGTWTEIFGNDADEIFRANEYLVVGDGFSVKFISKSRELSHAELLWAYELIYKDNKWTRQRRLNGDETGIGSDHNVELQFFENRPAVATAKIFSYD